MSVILDVALIAIVLIVMLVGIFRGFLKSTFGLVNAVCCLAAFIFLMPMIVNKLAATTAIANLGTSIGKLFGKLGGYMTVQVSAGEDVAAALSGAGVLKSICVSLVNRGLKGGRASVSAADMLGLYVLKFLLGIIVVLLLAFLIKRILKLIIWALSKLHKIKFFKILDRFLGWVYCTAMTALVFLLVLGELKVLAPRIPAVDEAIKQTSVVKLIYDENPLQGFIESNLNIEKTIASFRPSGGETPAE